LLWRTHGKKRDVCATRVCALVHLNDCRASMCIRNPPREAGSHGQRSLDRGLFKCAISQWRSHVVNLNGHAAAGAWP
jgi:hypothetical protein